MSAIPASPTDAPANFASVRAAAARLGVTDRQVLRMLAAGQLEAFVEPGRSVKVKRDSIERYLAAPPTPGA